jgi:hypothetical protein
VVQGQLQRRKKPALIKGLNPTTIHKCQSLVRNPIERAGSRVSISFPDRPRHIGNAYISLNHMADGEKVRFTVSFSVTGAQLVSLKVVATHVPKELGALAPPKKIRLTG